MDSHRNDEQMSKVRVEHQPDIYVFKSTLTLLCYRKKHLRIVYSIQPFPNAYRESSPGGNRPNIDQAKSPLEGVGKDRGSSGERGVLASKENKWI